MDIVQQHIDGFTFDGTHYCCTHCKCRFEQGVIYQSGERMCDAHLAAVEHVAAAHGSAFEALLTLDKRGNGLSDTQKKFLHHFYSGTPDAAVAELTGSSPSTVRFQRFSFREKVKQAQVLLALAELLERRPSPPSPPDKVHATATQIDERYMTDDEEERKILRTYFTDDNPPTLRQLPPREKKKLVVLRHIASRFERGAKYTEKEINAQLKQLHHDFATLRRYLIEYGFMGRTTDGSEYWLK